MVGGPERLARIQYSVFILGLALCYKTGMYGDGCQSLNSNQALYLFYVGLQFFPIVLANIFLLMIV